MWLNSSSVLDSRSVRMVIVARFCMLRRIHVRTGGCRAIQFALLSFFAAALPAQRRTAKGPSGSGRAAANTDVLTAVAVVTIPSAVFHNNREAYVWLPSGESVSAERYPVLIFPDAEEKGQFRAALANVQFLIDRQLIPPMMVVGVPYFANRRHELTPVATGATAQTYPAAGGADDNLRFIGEELLPWIDARYPTVQTRILVGHSLGGLFALYSMVAKPDLFRVVVALSPPLTWNDGSLSADVASRLATDKSRRRTLFLASGGLEPSIDVPVTDFATRLTRLLDSLKTKNLSFERQRYPGDVHEMTPLPGLVDGLRMAFEPLVVPFDSVAHVLSQRQRPDSAEILGAAVALESRYDAAAAILGVPGRFPEAPLDALGSYALSSKFAGLAVTLLRENRDRYPASSNAHESFGEALAAVGDSTSAEHELRTAIAIAHDTLRTTRSIISRTRARGVTAAATAQLRVMHRRAPDQQRS